MKMNPRIKIEIKITLPGINKTFKKRLTASELLSRELENADDPIGLLLALAAAGVIGCAIAKKFNKD